MTKEPKSIFIFKSHTWDQISGKATFSYQIKHNNEVFDFTEMLTFSFADQAKDIPEELVKSLLNNLLIVLGISYYKVFCPKEIILEKITLSREQANFWNKIYTKGLGEFFYQNSIDFRGLVQFPYSVDAANSSVVLPRQNRSLVGIGGGKDSIVTAELLKAQNKHFSNFMLSPHPLQKEISEMIGEDTFIVKRQLDSQLFELNNRIDIFNGHVPVSAMYAFVGLFAAILYDYRYIIVSNEQSANYGNVSYLGDIVNHQWSKSFEFEKLFQQYVSDYITPDVSYFSLLRPWTEIAIVKQFVQYPKYFPYFSSCNRNFRINSKGSNTTWCGECPKCAFAFIMLAAFLPKHEVIKIFGQNLLANESLVQTYKELLGVSAIKPFDCVGTPEEVMVAFALAHEKETYEADPIMRFFKETLLPQTQDIEQLKEAVLQKAKEHNIPEEFQTIV